MKQDEPALIMRILNGEHDEYSVLIDRYKEGLYRHCFRFVRDENIAEDLAQDTFIQAFLHLNQYNANYRFSTWLYKIATNLALAHLRRYHPRLLEEGEIDAIVSTLPPPDRLAVHSELHQALQQLPPSHRRTIELFYWRGMSYKQIATTLSTTTNTIRIWMYRAKKQLKEMLS